MADSMSTPAWRHHVSFQRSAGVEREADAVDGAMELVGPVNFTCTMWLTGPEMDRFARLGDVGEDGSVHRIASSQVTQYDAPSADRVRVDMGHVACQLAAGRHRRCSA